MVRIVGAFAAALVGFAWLASEPPALAQDVKKKAPNTSVLSGKIVQVNLDSDTKKIESLFVEVQTGRKFNRNVRIDDKTKIEYPESVKAADQKLAQGQSVSVKLRPESDLADTIKVTTAAAKKKKV